MLSASKLFETAQNKLDRDSLFNLLNSLNDAIFAFDDKGSVIFANGHALGLLDSHSIDGRHVAEILKLTDSTGAEVDTGKLVGLKVPFVSSDFSIKHDHSTVKIYMSAAPITKGVKRQSTGGVVVLMRALA